MDFSPLLLTMMIVGQHFAPAPPPESAPVSFRASASVVLIPATVLDRTGALVSGLSEAAFSVTQDKVQQRITSFGEQDLAASLGIVLDTSGSMRAVLPLAKSGLRTFFDSCNPEDEAFLYTVSTRPQTNSAFTSDFGTLLGDTVFIGAEGSTALIDTIFAAVRQGRSGRNPRKALLVISDGMDNHSRHSKRELIAAAEEADLQIYSLSVFAPPLSKKPMELTEERQGLAFLRELTLRTGGFQLVVRSDRDMERAAAEIGRAIRNQYVIGYVPDETSREGVWHSIRVKLNVPDATVYSRSGFFAR